MRSSKPKRSDLYTLYYPRVNCLKNIPFTAAHTYIAHIWQSPPRESIEDNQDRCVFELSLVMHLQFQTLICRRPFQKKVFKSSVAA